MLRCKMPRYIFILCILSFIISAIIWYEHEATIDSNKINFPLINRKVYEGQPGQRIPAEDRLEGKKRRLVTIFVSFVDDTGVTNYNYRSFVQTNFIKMTNYDCFKDVYFIIYTNSNKWKRLIEEENPRVHILPNSLKGKFSSPMYKDAYRTAMSTTNSFFYMQVNSCGLYDISLIETLQAVREAWSAGQIRQKLFMVGRRHNLVFDKYIEKEEDFLKYFKQGELYLDHALDYTIVTKETIEWDLFPEILLGMAFGDFMLMDHAIHSEIETFDATNGIRLLHQSQQSVQDTNNDERNSISNSWTLMLSVNNIDHVFASNARYQFEVRNEIKIFDKKTDSTLRKYTAKEQTSFLRQHKYWVDYSTVENQYESSPSLTIVVLAYNKPHSLSRLLNSLISTQYWGTRIDLVISLDIGHMGYFDLPTLIVANEFSWKHGKKKVVLKQKHRGILHQWIEAYDCVDKYEEPQIIILEDCIVLSPYWYAYLMTVMQYSKNSGVDMRIVGWTLEVPVVSGNPDFTHKMFTDLYAEKTSIITAGIKRVRSFVPIRKTWTRFIRWFLEGAQTIPVNSLVGFIVDELEHRGNWTNWQSHMWHPWFRYFLNSDDSENNQIMFIFDQLGALSLKVFQTQSFDPITYRLDIINELLANEHSIDSIQHSPENSRIYLPKAVETFEYETDLKNN